MANYTRLSYQLKRKVSNFSKKISKNLSRPKTKFIFQMIYGLLNSQSVLLSNIARALKEDILLKKTVERLSRNLENFNDNDQEQLINDYFNEVKSHIYSSLESGFKSRNIEY